MPATMSLVFVPPEPRISKKMRLKLKVYRMKKLTKPKDLVKRVIRRKKAAKRQRKLRHKLKAKLTKPKLVIGEEEVFWSKREHLTSLIKHSLMLTSLAMRTSRRRVRVSIEW